MPRVLILDDDFVSAKVWRSIIRQIDKSSTVLWYPSISALKSEFPNILKPNDHFDILITDMFLSGDETGLDFLKSLPPNMQRRAILSSSFNETTAQQLLNSFEVSCQYHEKPIYIDRAKYSLANLGLNSLSEEHVQIERTNHDTKCKPVIMITGANSGIGLALADLLTNDGTYRLALTAREENEFRLRKRYEGNQNVMVVTMDLLKEHQIKRAVDRVLMEWSRIDILINNAGICFRSVSEQMDSASELEQMQTNYLGPMSLIRSVIPTMREKGRGKIINVSSVSGIQGIPTMGSYSASKHALEGSSESLWHELRPFGVDVTIIRPGFINSQGHKRTRRTSKGILAEKINGPYGDYYPAMSTFITDLMETSNSTSNSVALEIRKVIRTSNPSLVYNVTADAKIFSYARRFFSLPVINWLIFTFFSIRFAFGGKHSRLDPKRRPWFESIANVISPRKKIRMNQLIFIAKFYVSSSCV